jgi:hypothetical protein
LTLKKGSVGPGRRAGWLMGAASSFRGVGKDRDRRMRGPEFRVPSPEECEELKGTARRGSKRLVRWDDEEAGPDRARVDRCPGDPSTKEDCSTVVRSDTEKLLVMLLRVICWALVGG